MVRLNRLQHRSLLVLSSVWFVGSFTANQNWSLMPVAAGRLSVPVGVGTSAKDMPLDGIKVESDLDCLAKQSARASPKLDVSDFNCTEAV